MNTVVPLDASRTALVVIDMQNFFVEPGAALEVPAARDIVDNINTISSAMRAQGGMVAWLKMTFRPDELTKHWTAFLPVNDTGKGAAMFAPIEDGSHGHDLWAPLHVEADDLIINKNRFSALIQGSSELQIALDAANIDTLIIVGTLTNVCCESTARDAMMLNYNVIVVDDANATLTDEAHQASLANIAMFFGQVQSTADVVDRLTQASITV